MISNNLLRSTDDKKIAEELLAIKKQIQKSGTTTITNIVNKSSAISEESTTIDDTSDNLSETFSSFKINDELANHLLIPEIQEAFGVKCLELPIGEDSGEVTTDRNITIMWDDLKTVDALYFQENGNSNLMNGLQCKNGKTGENGIVLTYELSRKISDYAIWFYVRPTNDFPVNLFPGDPTIYSENEGWFFCGFSDSNQKLIKCPTGSYVAIWVGFRQKNTVSTIPMRNYNYKN